MKDQVLDALQRMSGESSSSLQLTFKEEGIEGAECLLKMEREYRVVIEPRMMTLLANVFGKQSWKPLPERTVTVLTTGAFDKSLFVDRLSSSLEDIKLLEK